MDLTKNLPSTDEIIRALGLNNLSHLGQLGSAALNGRRSSGNEILPGLALFGAGILVGAGLALLFAPITGEELREEISHRAGELKERVLPADGGEAHHA